MTLSSEKINDLSTPGLNWHSHLMKTINTTFRLLKGKHTQSFKDRKVNDIYGGHIMVLQRKLSLWILYKESNTCYVPWCFFLMFKGFLNTPLDFSHGVPWSLFSFTSAAKNMPSFNESVLLEGISHILSWWFAPRPLGGLLHAACMLRL